MSVDLKKRKSEYKLPQAQQRYCHHQKVYKYQMWGRRCSYGTQKQKFGHIDLHTKNKLIIFKNEVFYYYSLRPYDLY